MKIQWITDVTTRFNPFSPAAKSARLFLSMLPPNARAQGLNIRTQLLPRASRDRSTVQITFKGGKVMVLDCEKTPIQSVLEQVERHSRTLQKAADIENAS